MAKSVCVSDSDLTLEQKAPALTSSSSKPASRSQSTRSRSETACGAQMWHGLSGATLAIGSLAMHSATKSTGQRSVCGQ